jgi:hypothetical protein
VNLKQIAPVAIAVLAVAATGCGSDKKSSSSSASTASQQIKGPKIGVTFAKPKANGIAKHGTLTAAVKLKNFKLDPQAVGKAPQPGKGHLHFSVDNGKFDYPRYSGANGKLAKKLGVTGKYSPSVTPTITYKGLPRGKHTISVQLANNNHSNAGASAKVTFTAK